MSNDKLTKAEFVDFVRAHRYGVVATVDRRGDPEAAVVDLVITDAGVLLFASKKSARKVRNLASNDRVAMVVGAEPVSLQIEGSAELLVGAEREGPAADYQEHLPHRPLLTDDYALHRVQPDFVRYNEYESGQVVLAVEGVPE